MRAIYRGRLCGITDELGDDAVLDYEMTVSFGDPDLIVDPTDDQVAAARAGRPIPRDPEADAEVLLLALELATRR